MADSYRLADSRKRLSVATRLRNAFIGISLFSLLATAVGLVSLHVIQDAQDTVLDRTIPAMDNAQRLAIEGLTIIEAMPAMITAEDSASLEAEVARVEAAEARLDVLLEALRRSDVNQGLLSETDVILETILHNLSLLAKLIAERDALRAEAAKQGEKAQGAMLAIDVALSPLIIDVTDGFLEKAERIDQRLRDDRPVDRNLRESFSELTEGDYFAVAALVEMRFVARSLWEKIERVQLTTAASEITQIRNQLNLELRGLIRSALEIQEVATKKKVVTSIEEFTGLVRSDQSIFDNHRRLLLIDERLRTVTQENRRSSNILSDLVDGLRADTARLMGVHRTDAKRALLFGQVMLVLISVIAFVAAALVVRHYVMRAVVKRTLRLAEITRQVACGELDVEIDVGGPDELGEMADAVRVFQANAVELRRSNAELEQFAYIASHDLQEPLRTLASYTELLERRYKGQLDETADRFIHNSRAAALRMIAMIDGLLVFSRAGVADVVMASMDANEAAEAALANLQVALHEADATVIVGSLPLVYGNATQLTNLFQNIIGNSLKYRQQDLLPKISIRSEKKGNLWQITVADNGIGMDMQYTQQVFKIFKRLHNRSEIEGAGLGLAISKRIVESHGGRIWFDSEEGAGTQVHFTLQDDKVAAMFNDYPEQVVLAKAS